MLFLLSGMNTAEMAVLSVFWQKNDLGTLGVNRMIIVYFDCCVTICRVGIASFSIVVL